MRLKEHSYALFCGGFFVFFFRTKLSVLNDVNVMASYCMRHTFNKMRNARWDLWQIFVCVGCPNPDKAPRSSLQPGEALSLLPALKAAKNCLSDFRQSPNQVVNYWTCLWKLHVC